MQTHHLQLTWTHVNLKNPLPRILIKCVSSGFKSPLAAALLYSWRHYSPHLIHALTIKNEQMKNV